MVDGHGTAPGVVLVHAGVVGDRAVVAHEPELIVAQFDGAELGVALGAAGVEVFVLVEGDTVDDDAVLFVTALDGVPGQADDPLDVLLAGGGRAELLLDPLEAPCHGVGGFGDVHGVGVVPGSVAVEDHDLPTFDVAELVDDLVDQHPVTDEKGVLHGGGGDVERLHHKCADDERQDQGDRDEDRQFLPEGTRALFLRSAVGLAHRLLRPLLRLRRAGVTAPGDTSGSRVPVGYAGARVGAVLLRAWSVRILLGKPVRAEVPVVVGHQCESLSVLRRQWWLSSPMGPTEATTWRARGARGYWRPCRAGGAGSTAWRGARGRGRRPHTSRPPGCGWGRPAPRRRRS